MTVHKLGSITLRVIAACRANLMKGAGISGKMRIFKKVWRSIIQHTHATIHHGLIGRKTLDNNSNLLHDILVIPIIYGFCHFKNPEGEQQRAHNCQKVVGFNTVDAVIEVAATAVAVRESPDHAFLLT